MNKDEQKLEKITEDFTKSILANTFEEVGFYMKLALRLAALMDAEIDHNKNREKFLAESAQFWPKEVKN